MAFFQLLSESQDTGVRRLGVTQELLSLVTGLAHYLKLLIRICLQGCLKLERDTNSEQGLREFMDNTNKLEGKLEAEEYSDARNSRDYIDVSADTCPVCTKPVEDRCFRHQDKIFHWSCMNCARCQRQLHADYIYAYWDRRDERLLGKECVDDEAYVESGFKMVSRLEQYAHLLRVAHARLLATLRTSGAVPHTSGKTLTTDTL